MVIILHAEFRVPFEMESCSSCVQRVCVSTRTALPHLCETTSGPSVVGFYAVRGCELSGPVVQPSSKDGCLPGDSRAGCSGMGRPNARTARRIAMPAGGAATERCCLLCRRVRCCLSGSVLAKMRRAQRIEKTLRREPDWECGVRGFVFTTMHGKV